MSLVLKQDLLITDPAVAYVLMRELGVGNDFQLEGPFVWPSGKQLPESPLHPIAAQAFAMAGFVVQDADGFQYVWDTHEQCFVVLNDELEGFDFTNLDRLESAKQPFKAVIVGHQDPEVL